MDFNKHIKEIEEKIGYSFKDKSLLRQAFTRTSFCNENKGESGLKYQSNEVLEFFGDSVLSAAIVTLLMRDFAKRYEYGIETDLHEGDFSNIKSKLSDKKNLSLATKNMGLQKFLQMGGGDKKLGVENEPSVMEDLFESIIGAIYIDCGNDVKTVIRSVSKMLDVQEYLKAKNNPPIQSFKNALQEFCADKQHPYPAPVYKTLSESGPDHKKTYERACFIGEKVYGVGVGKNQKLADAMAAEKALSALTEIFNQKSQKDDAAKKLKEYAAKSKLPSPEFRDRGETARSNEKTREYAVECRFSGLCATGVSSDKRNAKNIAAKKVLTEIEKQKTEKKKVPKNHAKKSANPPKKQIKKAAAK